eukprot:5065651-Pyramimonas_sp.AAC.1
MDAEAAADAASGAWGLAADKDAREAEEQEWGDDALDQLGSNVIEDGDFDDQESWNTELSAVAS